MKINVVTVTYGKRFSFLEKVLNSVVKDSRVDKVILVDNGSANGNEIDSYIANNTKNNIILLRNAKNEGSAGGFRKGIEEARKNVSDYVLLLDDDNVMEDNWSDYFFNILSFFPDREKVVLKGNRNAGLNMATVPSDKDRLAMIDYMSFGKLKSLFFKTNNTGPFHPILYMPNGAIAYGGSFIPFKAIVDTDLPFEPFYLYADDVEYLFRIKQKGYNSYQLSKPFIYDVDQTFSDYTSHLGSYDKSVSLIKLFFMTRNQYAIVLMTKSQSKISVILNALFGISTKIIFAFIKLGINKFTIERSKTIIHAVYDGINLKFNNEENIKKYIR